QRAPAQVPAAAAGAPVDALVVAVPPAHEGLGLAGLALVQVAGLPLAGRLLALPQLLRRRPARRAVPGLPPPTPPRRPRRRGGAAHEDGGVRSGTVHAPCLPPDQAEPAAAGREATATATSSKGTRYAKRVFRYQTSRPSRVRSTSARGSPSRSAYSAALLTARSKRASRGGATPSRIRSAPGVGPSARPSAAVAAAHLVAQRLQRPPARLLRGGVLERQADGAAGLAHREHLEVLDVHARLREGRRYAGELAGAVEHRHHQLPARGEQAALHDRHGVAGALGGRGALQQGVGVVEGLLQLGERAAERPQGL